MEAASCLFGPPRRRMARRKGRVNGSAVASASSRPFLFPRTTGPGSGRDAAPSGAGPRHSFYGRLR
jgi:hypothetical protein